MCRPDRGRGSCCWGRLAAVRRSPGRRRRRALPRTPPGRGPYAWLSFRRAPVGARSGAESTSRTARSRVPDDFPARAPSQ
jgi:hypothetical protein